MSADVLLRFMTLINYNCSRKFKSVFTDLIEYRSFEGYLQNLAAWTQQMKKKQIFKIPRAISKEIVSMASSNCICLESSFYKNEMGEGWSAYDKSYPCRVVAIRVGWILNDHHGFKFLQEVSKTQKLELFKIKTLQMIIEYLYQMQKRSLLLWQVPPFLI